MRKLSGEMRNIINPQISSKLPQIIRLQEAWEKIAPSQALQHTNNITISRKKKDPLILIYVENSHWAAELGTQKEFYRMLLEKEMKMKVPDIVFLVTQKKQYNRTFIKNKENGIKENDKEISIALTQEEDGYARELTLRIKDEELRNKLYKAMKADLEWKKGTGGLKLPENTLESPETIQ